MKTEHDKQYKMLMDGLLSILEGSDRVVLLLIHNECVFIRKEYIEKIEMLENRIKALQLELTFAAQK